VDAELVGDDAVTTAGLLIADASAALPTPRDLRGTLVTVTAGEQDVDVDRLAAALAAP
jgi:hypothetical protein